MKKRLLTSLMLTLLALFMLPGQAGAWNDVYLLCSDNNYSTNADYKFTKVNDNSFYFDLPVANITSADFSFRFSVDPDQSRGHSNWGPAVDGTAISTTDYYSAIENSSNKFKIEQVSNAESCRIILNYNNSVDDWKWHITAEVMTGPQVFTVGITDPGWDAVYAYAWTGETPVVAWPGTPLEKVGDSYTYTYNGLAAPGYVIFNNNNGIQTPDLAFANGSTYDYVWTLVGATSYEDAGYTWHDYDSEPIFGTAWNTDLAANDMTVSADGTTWTITKNNVELVANTHLQFKATFGHNGWNYNVGSHSSDYGGNVHLKIEEAGTYDITFTLVTSSSGVLDNSTLMVNAVKQLVPQDYTVAIADPGWDAVYAYAWTGETPIAGAWPGTPLTKADGKYTFTYNSTTSPDGVIFNNGDGNGIQTPDLAFVNGKTYTDVWTIMGATQNASWEDYATEPIFGTKWTADVAGNDMTSADGKTWTWTKNNVALEANTHIKYKATYSHCGTDYVVGSTGGDGMKVLDILIAGKYDITFTFTRDGNSSAVTATATKTSEAVTIGASGWATTVTNSALDFSGLTESFKAYTATLDGTTVSLNEVADVQAETGLVLKGTAGTYYAPVITESETAKGDLQFSSIYSFTVNDNDNDYYCYGLHLVGENAQFAKIKNGQVIPAQKAFLMVGKSVGARELSIAFGDETTSISNLNANGNLNDNATRYNLAGQKVSNSYKGIVIVNGKKYINK